jgi:hypothetical protein
VFLITFSCSAQINHRLVHKSSWKSSARLRDQRIG